MRQRSRPHWRGLDGLRALAVIAVVFYHFSPNTLPGGLVGVDVFFVISGYLITRLITEEFLAQGRINTVTFYRRRARRLLPALVLLLGAVSTAALIWRDQLATVRGGVLSTAVFGANWWLALDHQSYFVATGRPSMLQHLWSLGVEEQFYLVWPVIAAATLASGRRAAARQADASPRRIVVRLSVVAFALSVLSTALMWWLANRHNVPYGTYSSTLYYSTETHCMGLLLGASYGAWCAAETRPARANLVTDVAGVAALAWLLWFMIKVSYSSPSLFRGDFFWVSAAVVVVIASATRSASRVGRFLDGPLLRWVGVRSYSIYLWHWPIDVVTRPGIDNSLPVALDQLLRVVLTLLLADASYRFIESPVRRLGFRGALDSAVDSVRSQWRRVPPRAAVASPLVLLTLAGIGAVVIVVGPAAPTSSAASSASHGGRNLTLTPKPHPSTTATSPATTTTTRGGGQLRLPKLSAFGDSVILGARGALATRFPGGTMDAVEGRQPDPILEDVVHAAHKGTLNPFVVIHVGDNGLIDPDILQAALQSLAGAQLVLVLTDHLDPYDHTWQKPNNALIKSTVPKYANARVLDWDTIAGRHPHWLYQDDLHLKPAGAVAYAKLVVNAYKDYVNRTASGPSFS